MPRNGAKAIEFISPSKAAERYAHGTRARYTLAKCRCLPCRAASSDYETQRAAAKRKPWKCHHCGGDWWVVRNRETGEVAFKTKSREDAFKHRDKRNKAVVMRPPSQLVDVAPARAHIEQLKAAGVPVLTIAQRAHVSRNVLLRIMSGRIRRTRRATLDRILGVTSTGGAEALASATWAMLDRLLEIGYPKRRIARELGSRAKSPALQLRRDAISVRNARKVRTLYVRVWLRNVKLRVLDPVVPVEVKRRREAPQSRWPARIDSMPVDEFTIGVSTLPLGDAAAGGNV